MAEEQLSGGVMSGKELQAAREARGLSVHQLAVELHVSDAMINAMERGEYSALGEPVFVRGHLRNYARALGLAEAPVLAAYDQTQNKPQTPTLVASVPHTAGIGMSPRARDWSTRTATAVFVLVLIGLAVSWWLRRPEIPDTQPMATAPAAATAVAPTVSTKPMTALTDLADSATAQKPAKAAASSISKNSSVAAARPAAKPAATATHAAVLQPTPVVPVADRDLTHVKFILGAASWVEVYDNNGKRLFYDLAPAGDNLELSGAGPLQVFLGNAPGVSIELEGAPFDLKPFLRSDNTARFKLGSAAKPQ
ncbi:MAG TPA: RodZ domain-containing protein [Gammaproteobacteria bacterium]|jgi:cytoskeleton protein RodZ